MLLLDLLHTLNHVMAQLMPRLRVWSQDWVSRETFPFTVTHKLVSKALVRPTASTSKANRPLLCCTGFQRDAHMQVPLAPVIHMRCSMQFIRLSSAGSTSSHPPLALMSMYWASMPYASMRNLGNSCTTKEIAQGLSALLRGTPQIPECMCTLDGIERVLLKGGLQ